MNALSYFFIAFLQFVIEAFFSKRLSSAKFFYFVFVYLALEKSNSVVVAVVVVVVHHLQNFTNIF